MSNENDFSERIKVDLTETEPPRTQAFNRDVYTCLKLMGDAEKVQSFILEIRQQEVEGKKISMDMSMGYYYSIKELLGMAECDFREGKIGGNEFNNRINKVCKNQNLDFNHLIEITHQISKLEKKPNRSASIKLAQEIEAHTIKEYEKRMQNEKEQEKP